MRISVGIIGGLLAALVPAEFFATSCCRDPDR
jgi:hypothetical protein